MATPLATQSSMAQAAQSYCWPPTSRFLNRQRFSL
jgi:hypothetical protein